MFGRWSTSDKYVALRAGGNDGESDAPATPLHNRPGLAPFVVAICVVCTIANIVILSLSHAAPTVPDNLSMSRVDLHKLRRPSQYIGLDEVTRPSPPTPVQFDNYPIVVAVMDSERPKQVFNTDLRTYMSRSGTISSEERRILVTGTVSTVVQFRAIDYGMEMCEIHVDLPRLLANTTPYSGHTVMVSLFRLDAPAPIDTNKLSYNTRPSRLFKIDDIPLSSDGITRWHRKMACASEEVLSFELSRAAFDSDFECHIEWWQNREGNVDGPGFYITQHSTV